MSPNEDGGVTVGISASSALSPPQQSQTRTAVTQSAQTSKHHQSVLVGNNNITMAAGRTSTAASPNFTNGVGNYSASPTANGASGGADDSHTHHQNHPGPTSSSGSAASGSTTPTMAGKFNDDGTAANLKTFNLPASAASDPHTPGIMDDQASTASLSRSTNSIMPSPTSTTTIFPDRTVFVSSLPSGVTEEQLHGQLLHLFEPFSAVKPTITIKRDRMACMYAYIELQSTAEVDRVIKELVNREINNVRMRLERVYVNCTLYIARFPRPQSVQNFKELLDSHVPTASLVLCKPQEASAPPQTKQHRGAAFVTYASRQTAQRAHEILSTTYKDWVVAWEMPQSDTPTQNTDLNTLFIGGLNRKMATKELIRERFQAYGNVVAVDLILNESDERNRSAFAFVRYAESYSAPFAIEAENGSEWLGKRIRVQFCEPPDVKQRRRNVQQTYYPTVSPYYSRPDMMPVMAFPNYYVMASSMEYGAPSQFIPVQTGTGGPAFLVPSMGAVPSAAGSSGAATPPTTTNEAEQQQQQHQQFASGTHPQHTKQSHQPLAPQHFQQQYQNNYQYHHLVPQQLQHPRRNDNREAINTVTHSGPAGAFTPTAPASSATTSAPVHQPAVAPSLNFMVYPPSSQPQPHHAATGGNSAAANHYHPLHAHPAAGHYGWQMAPMMPYPSARGGPPTEHQVGVPSGPQHFVPVMYSPPAAYGINADGSPLMPSTYAAFAPPSAAGAATGSETGSPQLRGDPRVLSEALLNMRIK